MHSLPYCHTRYPSRAFSGGNPRRAASARGHAAAKNHPFGVRAENRRAAPHGGPEAGGADVVWRLEKKHPSSSHRRVVNRTLPSEGRALGSFKTGAPGAAEAPAAISAWRNKP